MESGQPVRRVLVDILGRKVRESALAFDGSTVHVDTEYAGDARVSRQSEPYFAASTPQWNTFAYDGVGRATQLSAADSVASSISAYDGYRTTVTDRYIWGQSRN